MQPPRGDAQGRREGRRGAIARPRLALTVCVVSALALHLLLLGHAPHGRLVLAPAPAQPVAVRLVGAAPASPAQAKPAPPADPDRATAEPKAVIHAPATPVDPAVPGSRAARRDYVPRGLLSQPPRPVSDIAIPFPETGAVEFDLSVELTLFIDEFGEVRRVRVDDPGLAPALEQAAMAVFHTAHFIPREVDGQPVRSMVRVAVRFEAARIPELPAPAP